VESTTSKSTETDFFENGEKSFSNQEAASSSPVTTFTISSSYEKEEFGESHFFFLSLQKNN
jgi:hypothetical protein